MKIDENKKLTPFNFNLPTELYEELRRIAFEKHTTITDEICRFIRKGLGKKKYE